MRQKNITTTHTTDYTASRALIENRLVKKSIYAAYKYHPLPTKVTQFVCSLLLATSLLSESTVPLYRATPKSLGPENNHFLAQLR